MVSRRRKLADRLHNMRTLKFKSEFKQKENALETLEVFVPMAYYIGAYRIKSELEDLSLRYLKPDMYKKIGEKKQRIELESDTCLKEMLSKINSMLCDEKLIEIKEEKKSNKKQKRTKSKERSQKNESYKIFQKSWTWI